MTLDGKCGAYSFFQERRGGRSRGEESRWDGSKVGGVESVEGGEEKAGRGVKERLEVGDREEKEREKWE